jgi:two-component system, chemotaxis family, protein-glutamate methylesterase/glutaminase
MTARAEPTGTPVGGAPLLGVVIGASAGGPSAIETLLAPLPRNFPVPIAVCQHMTDGAIRLWAERLDSVCRLRVVEAAQGDEFVAGRVYIAPIGRHMRIRGSALAPVLSLEPDRFDSRHVPSIDLLMESAAVVFGSRVLGVLLTGMGADGSKGLLTIRRAGGVTLVESSESAFMPSMPESAVKIGAAGEVVPLAGMGDVIARRVTGKV